MQRYPEKQGGDGVGVRTLSYIGGEEGVCMGRGMMYGQCWPNVPFLDVGGGSVDVDIIITN